MGNLPEGWTDDMSVALPPGRNVNEAVSFVIHRAMANIPDEEIVADLESIFKLCRDDAELIFDRVFGGVVRAATGQLSNRPDRLKDPFAFTSYEIAQRDPQIIETLFPQYAPVASRPWWQFWS